MKKECTKCKKTKLLSEFYPHPEMADGHLNQCKKCKKEAVSQRYREPEARQRIIAYEREREKDPKRKAQKQEYQRRRRAKSPGKNTARGKVRRALINGTLIKKPCEMCGDEKSQAHHPDYRKYLNVRWLCRKHHMEVENKIPYPLKITHKNECTQR